MMEMNHFVWLGATAYESGYQTGQFLGQTVFVALFAALAWKCFAIARRPNANAKCALSLGVILSAMVVAALGGITVQQFPALRILAALAVLTALFAVAASLVLAIIGLVEYGQAEGRYTQGRAQAVWTLILAALFTCFIGAAFVRGLQQAFLKNQALARQPGTGEWLSFDDLNFKIRAPGKPWVQLDAKKLQKSAAVAFTQTQPQVFFIIIAEKTGISSTMTTESLVEIAKANQRSATQESRITKENSSRRQDLDGVEMETDAQTQLLHLFYRHWLCATNGYVYQLIAWGRIEDEKSVRTSSEALFSSFALIDYQRQAALPANDAGDFHSGLFSYNVKMGGSGWRPSPVMAKSIPAAEFTGWDANKNLGLFVVPVCLLDKNPPPEAVTIMMAGLGGMAYPSPEIMDEKPVLEGGMSGVEFGVEKAGSAGKFFYRVKILKAPQWAYLVGAYGQWKEKADVKALEETLARVEFPVHDVPPANLAEQFNEKDKNRQGLAFNDLGLFYYKARQYEKSADYFKTAFEFEKKSGVYLANVADAYIGAGKRQAALDYLEGNPVVLAESQAARALEAHLQMQLERVDSALTNFGALFANGYRNDDYFVEYATLLNQTRQQDVALAAVENYLKENDSAAVHLLEARLYKQKRNFAKAIELLKAQCRKYPYNAELSLSLADAYNQAGLYAEGMGICQQLIDADSDSGNAYYLKGCGEFGLKRYREAKASFEAALNKSPANADIKSYLDLVSGMLGEGSNSGVKEPIVAVPIPDRLRDTAPAAPASYLKDYGAQYLKEITAISFARKKEFKRTDYFTIKVLDASGIAAFSTIQFGFDPLSEGIFVNDLKVKDGEGKIVATGKVDDYYAVDAATRSQASQKKVLNIPVSGLRPGYLVELTVTRRDLAPPAEFPFTEHTVVTAFPVLEDIFFIRGETNAVKFSDLGTGTGPKNDDGLYWTREQPEVYKWEPLEQPPADFTPALDVGDTAATWDGEAGKYCETLGNYLQLDAAGRGLAERLAKNSGGEGAKVFQLARYVQTNYTYKALEFGRRARLPHTTAEILRNQYGDCKDHALLLQQLLEASGIPARLALVRTQGKVCKELPSLDQFDHMVVFLPAFRNGFFIDCTDKGSDLGQAVPLGLAGKEALILDAVNPRFVTIPDYPEGSSLLQVRREVRITNGTDVAVHEVLRLKGYNGSTLRAYFKQLQPPDRRNFVDQQLNRQSGEDGGFKLQNLDDTQAPLILELDYVIKRQFQLTGNLLVGKLPDMWEQFYASAEPVEHRVTPFELKFPINMESTITLLTPPGYRQPAVENFRQKVQTAFATSESEAQIEGSGLKIDYRLQRRAGKFAASDYATCQESMAKALGALEQTVVFAKQP